MPDPECPLSNLLCRQFDPAAMHSGPPPCRLYSRAGRLTVTVLHYLTQGGPWPKYLEKNCVVDLGLFAETQMKFLIRSVWSSIWSKICRKKLQIDNFFLIVPSTASWTSFFYCSVICWKYLLCFFYLFTFFVYEHSYSFVFGTGVRLRFNLCGRSRLRWTNFEFNSEVWYINTKVSVKTTFVFSCHSCQQENFLTADLLKQHIKESISSYLPNSDRISIKCSFILG